MEAEPRSDRLRQEPTVATRENGGAVNNSGDESDGEFEFSFASRPDPAAATGGATADELFYPVFGRVFDETRAPVRRPLGKLFLEESAPARNSSVGSTSSSSSSAATDATDLDGVSPDTYCVWTPGAPSPASSPARSPRKSGSTGSLSRWRRVSELLVIGRSHSEGRDKFRFLSAPPSPARDHQPKAKPSQRGAVNAKAATELDTVAASHRMFYGSPKGSASPGAARRTFLPYRQDLVGLFSNAKGLSRSPYYQPF
ncbi:uncharacterized protein LOC100822333 [Brachypodium distachyon]|uniref:DUF1645 family protein n=1 Tax=Brachypodium distachyon TaxID=15368 RepID=I1HPT1_BRADI|nr:uncharacterized protein LOC100822333 [Brachypodium distachyon]KQK08908.1 hypothetical protein BRADI_2g44840v3 [Brachypodium distachyon]|eukprot:XP_003569426.1 uncharacterized protein LOC100822333 [Brachypodium distachyon]